MKFKFDSFLEENPNMPIDCKLDEVYSRLAELTDDEPDKDLRSYDKWLLESIEDAIHYIHKLEKKVSKKSELTLEEINKINNELNKEIK